MKKLLFISILFVFAINIQAQYTGTVTDSMTTSTSTGSEVAYFRNATTKATTIGAAQKIQNSCSVDIIGTVTRISGTPDGYLFVQVANVLNPTQWATLDTVTITGNDPIPFHFEYTADEFDNMYLRFAAEAPSSTQSIKYTAEIKTTRKL